MQWTLFLLVLTGQWCLMVCQLYEYHYFEENKNWSDAQQYCRDHHTDLATVTNMTDMKRLHDTPMNMNGAWIGLFNQTNGTKECHWSLYGEEFNNSDTNWNKPNKEPNGNTENCGFIYSDLTWGDISCIRENVANLSFICFNESETSARFYLIYQNVTWLEAQRYCMENHTGLVSGLEQLQEDKLRIVIENITNYTYPYIGLFKDAWKWSDGSSFSFRYWNLKLNDEVVYNTGQCAMTVFTDGGRWMNDDCNNQKPFICYEVTSPRHHLILIQEKLNWEQALYYCRDNYHDLVTITSLDDQRWVQEKVKKASTPYVWTGLRYTCTLDFWFWVSDEVVTYKNWVPGGPQDDCDMSGAMETGGQHQWFKKNDAEELNFICSK